MDAWAVSAAGSCLFGAVAICTAREPVRTLGPLAAANLAYCPATVALRVTHRTTLTGWGGAYFAGESETVLALSTAEITAKSTTEHTTERSRYLVNFDWSLRIAHDISASTLRFHWTSASQHSGVSPRKHY